MKKPGKLTIRDIAKAAGVSAATVSLVLNGKGEISGVTRARVLEAVASLNYVPRATRSSAEPGETLRFLKIAKHGHTVNRDHSVFISDYIDGMSAEATRRNYTLEVVSFEGQPISTVAESLAGAPISGVIALGTELTEADIRLIQGLGLPTVFIDTFYDVLDANFVDMNNEDAVYKVLSRFRMQGFQRIGFVASHVDTTNFRLRREAFFKNMARLGLPVNEADILSVESTYDGPISIRAPCFPPASTLRNAISAPTTSLPTASSGRCANTASRSRRTSRSSASTTCRRARPWSRA